MWPKNTRCRNFAACCAIAAGMVVAVGAPEAVVAFEKDGARQLETTGRELFQREWRPNDSRSHGGDGLGPVFNDSSCVACHNLGGPGGGGPASKNVDIISATSSFSARRFPQRSPTGQFVRSIFGLGVQSSPAFSPSAMAARRKAERELLAKVHPGFRASRSVVLHRFGTDAKYAAWRQQLTGQTQFLGGFARPAVLVAQEDFAADTDAVESAGPPRRRRSPDFQQIQRANQEIQRLKMELGTTVFSRTSHHNGVTVVTSQRNAIALFGVGLIDAIPDTAIEAAAKNKHAGFPKVSGRVARLKDGRIGRFGWKAQKATLFDFAMTACAVELGLHVPDHPQSGVPLQPDYRPKGFDMDKKECIALVKYLENLPAPIELTPAGVKEAAFLGKGKQLFAKSGCSACHTPRLGNADGIYSDLLVHDLGPALGDTGDYGVFIPDSPGDDAEGQALPEITKAATSEGQTPAPGQQTAAPKRPLAAQRLEWRTPPLWGCRDSGPYLHDGRAKTLEQAIAFHGGEAADSARTYFMFSPDERQQVIAFLKSMVAPSANHLASVQR